MTIYINIPTITVRVKKCLVIPTTSNLLLIMIFFFQRYWPVAYLHKGPPPNITYFRYNSTDRPTTERKPDVPTVPPVAPSPPRERPPPDFSTDNPAKPNNNNIDKHRDEKTRNITNINDDIFSINLDKVDNATTTSKIEVKEITERIDDKKQDTDKKKDDMPEIETKTENIKQEDDLKGIDSKLGDFTSSIEVLDIEDAKTGEKNADLKTLEAEEKQIEAIGRLLASKRGQKLIIEKRSQKELESKSIALDKDLVDFNFGNKFPTIERRGTIQKVTKDEIERDRHMDRSLEVSETTFVRPPRVLSTTENIRKAIVNGKVFYNASLRDPKEIISSNNNSTRKYKSLRPLEERAPSVISNNNYGKKKVVRARNVNVTPVNPVRKVRRVYRRKYNPGEVRRRLLERERSLKEKDENRKV